MVFVWKHHGTYETNGSSCRTLVTGRVVESDGCAKVALIKHWTKDK